MPNKKIAALEQLPPLPDWQGKFPRGKTRWLRVNELPFSRGHVYHLIAQDLLFSVEFRLPGSRRSIRLIDAESLDAYLLKLGQQQRKAKQKPETAERPCAEEAAAKQTKHSG
jgi:hypothetical protein